MPRFRTISALAKKVKKGDEEDYSGDTKSGAWRLRRSRSFAVIPRRSASNSYEASESGMSSGLADIARRVNSSHSEAQGIDMTVRRNAGSQSYPSSPMSPASSKSDYTTASQPLPTSPNSTERPSLLRHLARVGSTDDFLSPPRPAFLKGRSSKVSRLASMSGSNPSTSSLISNSSCQMSDIGFSTTNSRSARGRSMFKAGQSSTQHYEEDALSPPRFGGRSGLRSFGRRFLSQIGAYSSASVDSIPSESERPTNFSAVSDDAAPRLTTALREGDVRPLAQESCPPTPPMSANTTSYSSSSSCTSSACNSPLMSPHQFPSLPSAVKTGTNRKSFQTASPIVNRYEWPVTPQCTSPDSYVLKSPAVTEGEDNSDFFKTVLNYTYSEIETPAIKRTSLLTNNVLTPMEVKKLEEDKGTRQKMGRRSIALTEFRSAWAKGDSDDSEDEYGNEDDEAEGNSSPPNLHTTRGQRTDGLDSSASKAAYTCTLMKFYPQLAASLAGQRAKTNCSVSDVRLPRSVNLAKSFQGHPSTYSHIRSMHIGLARGRIIRRLKTEVLSVSMEKELNWFIKKYLPHFIEPSQVNTQLAQRAAQSSLEALARPPLLQGNDHGMAQWARRAPYLERCEMVENPTIVLVLQDLHLNVGDILGEVKVKPKPMPLQLSKRCKALAGVQPATRSREPRAGLSSPPCSPPRLLSPQLEPETVVKASKSKSSFRRLSPWTTSTSPRRSKTEPVCVTEKTATLAEGSTLSSSSKPAVSTNVALGEELEEEEDVVPLAMLVDRRVRRATSERGYQLEADAIVDSSAHRVKQQRQLEAADKRAREVRIVEDQRRSLIQARERRKKTEHADILSSPTYGAGNALIDTKRRSKAVSEYAYSSRRTSMQAPASPPIPQQQRKVHHLPSQSSVRVRTTSTKTAPSSSRPLSQVPPPWNPALAQFQTLPATFHRHSHVPTMASHTMTPYGIVPMISPPAAMHHRQSMMMMNPSVCQAPSPYPAFSSPLVYLSPDQVPTLLVDRN